MLSEKLTSALTVLRHHRARELPMGEREMAALEAHLEGCVDQARALEGEPPTPVQRGDLPEGVVDLTRHRRFGRWLHSQIVPPIGGPRGPGGAA